MFHFVHEIIEPRTATVMYFGITTDPNGRLKQHTSCLGEAANARN